MQSSDFLCVPYLLEAESVEITPGEWIRRVSYPELPDCVAEHAVLEEAINLLERRRIEIILRLLSVGRKPPMPRPALAGTDAVWAAERAGLGAEISTLLGTPPRN